MILRSKARLKRKRKLVVLRRTLVAHPGAPRNALKKRIAGLQQPSLPPRDK